MKALANYVEVMFQEFPRTQKVLELKENILESMENKYEALIVEGILPQEALEIVKEQFGSIEELKEEYGCLPADKDVEYLTTEKLKEYLIFKRKYAHLIAVGVFMIIVAVSGVIFWGETLGVPILLIVVAIAVAIFVFINFKNNEYEDIDNGRYHLLGNDRVKIHERYDGFKSKYQVAITAGIFLCIVGVAIVYILSYILGITENVSYPLFLSLIAITVYLFIKYGIQDSAYRTLLRTNEVTKELNNKKDYRWIYGVTMPLSTILFLFVGFLSDAWVFPITAILISSLVVILSRIKKD